MLKKPSVIRDYVYHCARCGYIDLIQDRMHVWRTDRLDTLRGAIAGAQMSLYQMCLETRDRDMLCIAMREAARHDHLPMYLLAEKRLEQIASSVDVEDVIMTAARKQSLLYAVQHGSRHIWEHIYAHKQIQVSNSELLHKAVEANNVPVARYALDALFLNNPSLPGVLCLQYLEHHCVKLRDMRLLLCKYGRTSVIDMVKFARKLCLSAGLIPNYMDENIYMDIISHLCDDASVNDECKSLWWPVQLEHAIHRGDLDLVLATFSRLSYTLDSPHLVKNHLLDKAAEYDYVHIVRYIYDHFGTKYQTALYQCFEKATHTLSLSIVKQCLAWGWEPPNRWPLTSTFDDRYFSLLTLRESTHTFFQIYEPIVAGLDRYSIRYFVAQMMVVAIRCQHMELFFTILDRWPITMTEVYTMPFVDDYWLQMVELALKSSSRRMLRHLPWPTKSAYSDILHILTLAVKHGHLEDCLASLHRVGNDALREDRYPLTLHYTMGVAALGGKPHLLAYLHARLVAFDTTALEPVVLYVYDRCYLEKTETACEYTDVLRQLLAWGVPGPTKETLSLRRVSYPLIKVFSRNVDIDQMLLGRQTTPKVKSSTCLSKDQRYWLSEKLHGCKHLL
jgi:hypothetical protein